MNYRSRVLGIGMRVPSRVVTNHELASMMETSNEWIIERTGIEEHRWVSEDGHRAAGDVPPMLAPHQVHCARRRAYRSLAPSVTPRLLVLERAQQLARVVLRDRV